MTDQTKALVARLRAHAKAHEYIAGADPEQKQWMNDLYDAAGLIERLRCQLDQLLRMEDDGK